jgi:hemerythrin
MPFIEWKDEYSVNVASIDDQHRKLIAIINRLHEAMKVGKGREILSDVMAELIDYSDYHFTSEEGLMKKVGHPDIQGHIAEHNHFRQMVRSISDEVKGGNFVMTLEINEFLREWLVDHMLGTDRKYSDRFILYGIG